jgi:cytochrome P450 family 6
VLISESLRKYPPASNLIRCVTNDYKVPDSDVVFPKDLLVMIPVYAIQHDPENFKDPEQYDPDRFAPENEANIRPYSFLPFGEGPRNCIGLRFGMMQARVGLVALLSRFRFTLSPKMLVPLKFSTKSMILCPEGGLWLIVEEL